MVILGVGANNLGWLRQPNEVRFAEDIRMVPYVRRAIGRLVADLFEARFSYDNRKVPGVRGACSRELARVLKDRSSRCGVPVDWWGRGKGPRGRERV